MDKLAVFGLILAAVVLAVLADAGAQEGRWSTWGPDGYSSGTVTDLGSGQAAVQEWSFGTKPGLRSSRVVPYSATGSYINTWDFRDGSHSSTWTSGAPTTGPTAAPWSPPWLGTVGD